MKESETYMNVSIFIGTCANHYGIETGIYPESRPINDLILLLGEFSKHVFALDRAYIPPPSKIGMANIYMLLKCLSQGHIIKKKPIASIVQWLH